MNSGSAGVAPRLSIVIVTWNGWAYLKACLESIRRSDFADLEVIVIENGSTDGSAERLPVFFPEVCVHRNERNVGHSRGVNQGLKVARGELVLVLDNDTQLEEGTLGALVRFLDTHPEVSVVAPRTLSPDGRIEESARSLPTAMSGLFGRQSLLTHLFPGNRFSRRYLARENLQSTEPFRVQQVSAACMLFRRSLVDEIGPWDEGFWGYWVETDWCATVIRAGREIVCDPRVHVIHHEQNKRGRRKSPMRIWLFHRGAYRFYRKQCTRGVLDPRAILALVALGGRAALLMTWHWVLGWRGEARGDV